ncbi:ABC transporter substrate-binding protein [Aestuariimicrobium sp. p3-SID1156]|uniref:ABC transporter substrate-binding protein n=1 Tax=Aestuariimicrobium sp. p3-SID1156 TaxID=2916038 RepID=UPI00223B181A|nr:ABC transporter substrate-binding protein [Aestuariimicrobium sp. p3-SID1156]MCT1458018.1 ABC transporter substrate-binding protein [Aestuariimicrobium sp. p3-SID1156]
MTTNGFSRRGVLGAGISVGALGVLSACGGGKGAGSATTKATGDGGKSGYNGPDVSLLFWNGFTGGDGAFMKKLVEQFNGEHKNIKVTMQVMQWSDYYTKLPNAVQAGKGPDIAVMHVDSVATNAARKIVQPLDDVAKALELSETDFAPVPWKAGIYKDVRYSIPLDVHPLGFFYNKDLMDKAGLDAEKPPTDLNSYMDALDKLKGKGIQGHWASPHPFTGGLSMQSLIKQFGGSLYSEDATKAVYNEEPAIKAMTWWVDLIKKGYSPAKVGQDADFLALQNGKTAFNWNGIWSINTLKEKSDLKWGVAPLPNIGGTKAAWAGSHQFVLPTRKQADANKDQASRVFLNWISQHSLEWAKGGQVPARNSVRESAEFKALNEQAALATQIDDLVFLPAVPGIGDAGAEFDKAFNEIVLGGKDIKATLDAAVGRANKILEANAKKYGA